MLLLSLFDEIAEAIPFNFATGYRAFELNLALSNPDDFPISFARASVNPNFLSALERIRLKDSDIG